MKLSSEISAVVTGGASGLGAATASRLRESGAKVTLFDLNSDDGEKFAREIGASFAQVDVCDAAAVASALDGAHAAQDGLHILVNCAGIAPAAKTVSRDAPHDPALFSKVIGINLIGSFICGSHAATLMTRGSAQNDDGERGVIINTASVAAYEGQIGQVAYAASKAGVAGMTLPMARDLADKGVRVCSIAPGLFLTPMLEGLPQEVQDSLGGQVPFPSRLGKPEEYAALVAHIAENAMLNGEVIRLDGAIRMTPR